MAKKTDHSDLLTPGQAAKRLGVSVRTLQNWMDAGRVEFRLVGPYRMVHPADLEGVEPKDNRGWPLGKPRKPKGRKR